MTAEGLEMAASEYRLVTQAIESEGAKAAWMIEHSGSSHRPVRREACCSRVEATWVPALVPVPPPMAQVQVSA